MKNYPVVCLGIRRCLKMEEIKIKINTDIEHEFTECDLQRIVRTMAKSEYYKPMLEAVLSGRDTSVGRGFCPYPLKCRCYVGCDIYKCHYDEIENGYAFRRS